MSTLWSSSGRERQARLRQMIAAREAARAATAPPPSGERPAVTKATAKVVAARQGPPPSVDLFMEGGYVPGVRVIGALPAVGATVQVFQSGPEDRVVITGGGGAGETYGRRGAAKGGGVSQSLITPPYMREVELTDIWDFDGNLSTFPGGARYTAPEDGWYDINARMQLFTPTYEPSGFEAEFSSIFQIESPGGAIYLTSTKAFRWVADTKTIVELTMVVSGRIELAAGNPIRMALYVNSDPDVRFSIMTSQNNSTFLDVALAWR